MAILFVVTAVGIGLYAFWVNTHSTTSDGKPKTNYISCSNSQVTATQQKKNGKLEGAKLAGFTPIDHVSYLKCQDLKVGNGATVTATSNITAIYTGALAKNGIIFQSSEDTGKPFTTALDQVIKGWTAGIPGMKAGGKRRLIIPAQYAYGAQASGNIPANSDLVFDITLLAVK
ncbi:FKBP-type peptidyl-prolyl cis-trans isomerase [Candidatus Saccharibacteria bacterium]|nr:FKBP-type peptidyl-prolyl cis-trans isomerase [Candidatus Saccharibacteria bacterium]